MWVVGTCGTREREEKNVQCFDGKARRRVTTRKAEAWMGGQY
jgi:hypothetical protein